MPLSTYSSQESGMAEKRKSPSSISDESPYVKRARPSSVERDEAEEFSDDSGSSPRSTAPHQQPRLDPIYGQKHAFPGLDDDLDDSRLFYGPAEDGLEYLRMVR